MEDYPLEFPMAFGKAKLLSTKEVWAWKKAYQAVEVDAQLLRIVGWLERNPEKQSRTIKGLRTRISNWLSEEQFKATNFGKKKQGFAEPYWNEEDRKQVKETPWVAAHNEAQRVFDEAKRKDKGEKAMIDLKARIAALRKEV